ncbi:MAG TPA: bifunctional D-glycero-beta-D-manno-heptose-7-phosphate kinase/D-glycero-beta-D-manno-heptose 1-phosphate adenylyltransferase HldE [Candidatus Bathyarchaeia archaeon]|nr:bifunctional D-glycero-beta-D-manno-heptose-7-phosphate kinase/D-glycero-beta-D-manno-heptose 1-phosphate adenylyltransferase HldE [Candidatus Bathyarchaeia archaeon]
MTNYSPQSIRLVESGFGRPQVLVVGDVMLDKYVWGEVERISPEAPVPVLRIVHQSQQSGGAANVAMNLAGLGARVTVMGLGGDDDDQRSLEALLAAADVNFSLVACPGVPTTAKLRVLAGHQQLLRLDNELKRTEVNGAADVLLQNAMAMLPQAAVVVLSDYAKGALSERVCRALIGEARRLQIPVVVDPKGSDFTRYCGATTICPNAKELAAVTGKSAGDLKWLLPAGQKMVAALNLQHMLVTLGEKGIAILRPDTRIQVPAAARQVFDVSGAGDTVVAVVALGIAARMPVELVAQMANVAAGIVIGKVGTVPVQRDELLGALSQQMRSEPEGKVLPLEALQARVAGWRSRGLRVVFTNGCFDLLHVGHISLLERARHMGDRLIVAVNSDRSVRGLKGRRRPLVREQERAQVLAALASVDAVVVFDEATPLRLIEALRPDVLVKGGDYTENEVVGAAEVRGWGGRLELVPLVAGCSTSGLIERSAGSAAMGSQV